MIKKPKLKGNVKASPESKVRSQALKCLKLTQYHARTAPACDMPNYSALAGTEAPPKEAFQASMIEPRVLGSSVVTDEIWQYLQVDVGATPTTIAITLPLITGLENIYLNVLQSRKIKSDLKKSGVNHAIGMHQLLSRPADNKLGCEIYSALKLIAYGDGIDDEVMKELQRRLEVRFPPKFGQPIMEYHPLDRTMMAVAVASAQIFNMSEGNAKALKAQAKEMGVKNWTKRRSLREFCRFHALASVPFKQMCFAIGDGERILDKAIVEGRHLLKPLWKGKEVLHRDQIAQFTAAELMRLEMKHFRLPFIRVR